MGRFSLQTIESYKVRNSGSKKPGYEPKVSRSDLMGLCRAVLRLKDLKSVSRHIRKFALSVPSVSPSRHWSTGRMIQWANWQTSLMSLSEALKSERATFPIFTVRGNIKLQGGQSPFVAFSTLPIFTCPGRGDCENWCYSLTSWRYPGPFCRQLQNTLLLKHRPALIKRAFGMIPEGMTLRLYVDGDFGSLRDLRLWMRLLHKRPDLKCYGYSKSWDVLRMYDAKEEWPSNYVLNISSGGKSRATLDQMLALPITRGRFVSVKTDYRPSGHVGNIGIERYNDPKYHEAVRKAAADEGLGLVFSCPGTCNNCCGTEHACGSERFKGVTIAIGIH